MKKCVLFLCVLMCTIAYAGDVKEPKAKLSSGNKVNSAIDNPSSYYKARSLREQRHDSVPSSKQKVQSVVPNLFSEIVKK